MSNGTPCPNIETAAAAVSGLQETLGHITPAIEGELAMCSIGSGDRQTLDHIQARLRRVARQCLQLADSIAAEEDPVLTTAVDPDMLFDRFVPVHMIPEVEPPAPADCIPMTIFTDRLVRVNHGDNHTLRGVPLCILNSVLLTRDQWTSGVDLRSIGYDARASKGSTSYHSSFIRAVRHVQSLIPDQETPIIESEKRGKEKYFRLNPAIVVQDLR